LAGGRLSRRFIERNALTLVKLIAKYGYYKLSRFKWSSYMLMLYDPQFFLSIVNRRCPACGYVAPSVFAFNVHLTTRRACRSLILDIVAEALSGGYLNRGWVDVLFPRDAMRPYFNFCFGSSPPGGGDGFMCSEVVHLNWFRRSSSTFLVAKVPRDYKYDNVNEVHIPYYTARFSFPFDVYSRLVEIADRRGVTISDVVRDAVTAYVSGRCGGSG